MSKRLWSGSTRDVCTPVPLSCGIRRLALINEPVISTLGDVASVECVSAEICLTTITISDASVRERCEATTLWGEQLRAMLGQMQCTVHPTSAYNS
jgi:hypothetical protein